MAHAIGIKEVGHVARLDLEVEIARSERVTAAFRDGVEFDHAVQDAVRTVGDASEHGRNFKVRPWVDVGGWLH